MEIKKDRRVEFIAEWEAFPHFTVKIGEKGTVIENSDEKISIKMDNTIEGANYWDNCVHLYKKMQKDGVVFSKYIKEIE